MNEETNLKDVSPLPGDPFPQMPVIQPNMFRFYAGAISIGFGTGISWTLLFTGPVVLRYISHAHAVRFLYALVALTFILQIIILVKEKRRLNRQSAALKKYYDAQTDEFKRWCREAGIDPKRWSL
jgi:hypothetical protein